MAREINLVPDIKEEMIKALKLRNVIFFLCIVVAAASVAVVFVLGTIVGGQSLALNGKDDTLKELSEKVNSYDDLSDFLTIKDQLGALSSIADNKNVVSRTFGIMSALLPTGADVITVSELNVDLTSDAPTLNFEAQANAGKAPFIDYNVLDAFKKSMPYLRYDYGRYVDKNGNEIPTYCIIEAGADGATLSDAVKGVYAMWTIDKNGCNPTADDEKNASTETQKYLGDYEYEDYNGEQVVRIWRTPQYDDWYGKEQMGLDGYVNGVQHFESSCIVYNGQEDGDKVKWTSRNDSCMLVPEGTNGIAVSESSNGRDSSGELVLRFAATIALDSAVYKFANKHMLALGPTGRYNVTDSYMQIQAMFSEKAKDCLENDTSCKGGK